MPETENKNNVEKRVLLADDIELRVSEGKNPKLSGYAARFNKDSVDLGGFTERIAPGAFDDALGKSDVRALKNHDPNLVLGRTASKTLRLNANTKGLKFEVDMPDTTTGKDTVEEIRRGDITGCSFAFTVADGGDDWLDRPDGGWLRTINKVNELFDVGPVTYPAYPDTSVAARSLDAVKKENKQEPVEDNKVDTVRRQRDNERKYARQLCTIKEFK